MMETKRYTQITPSTIPTMAPRLLIKLLPALLTIGQIMGPIAVVR